MSQFVGTSISIRWHRQHTEDLCALFKFRFIFTVPPKVWHINEPDKDELEVNFAKDDKSEDNEWWNQKSLNNLDLSSNVITVISSEIGCLQDLEILNVIEKDFA